MPETIMPVSDALKILAEHRTSEIVVTTMGATREWSRISNSPYDFHYLPSAMGHAPMIALGLALAQPDREVVVLNGDGSMLMSLGCLVTIVASGARNLSVVVLDNGAYEVTGGQATAAANAGVDYAQVARGCGFPTADSFLDLEQWRSAVAGMFQSPGPRFFSLKVSPVTSDYVPAVAQSLSERIVALQRALGVE